VTYDVQYFGPSHTLAGIERQASEMGYTVHLSFVRQPAESGVQILHDLISYHVDGIIWAVSEIGANRGWVEGELCRSTVPVVFLDMRPCPNLPVVNIENRVGGYLATNHLFEQGRRKIGLITGPLDWWSAQERRAGWCDVLREAGLTAEESLVVEGTWSASSGERGFRRLLEQCPGVDAVFACNDQMALGVLKAARELGRRVPEDLAVVGFDDVPEAPFFCPSLTTVRQDLNGLGRSAVRELGRIIDARQQDQPEIELRTISLQPELIVRGSSVVPGR
jgi:LacI family transcriptional regulator